MEKLYILCQKRSSRNQSDLKIKLLRVVVLNENLFLLTCLRTLCTCSETSMRFSKIFNKKKILCSYRGMVKGSRKDPQTTFLDGVAA